MSSETVYCNLSIYLSIHKKKKKKEKSLRQKLQKPSQYLGSEPNRTVTKPDYYMLNNAIKLFICV